MVRDSSPDGPADSGQVASEREGADEEASSAEVRSEMTELPREESAVESPVERPSSSDAAHAPTALPEQPIRPLRPSEGSSGRSNARMTLFGTSLVFTVTLFAWGGAKVACNLHPPPYQEFKPAPLTRLASTPKDGALEFHHRLAIRDFAGARELVTDSGRALVEAAEAACDAACQAQREARSDAVVTRATLLRREGTTAVVRAESFYQGEVETRTYEVTWEERLWKVLGEGG